MLLKRMMKKIENKTLNIIIKSRWRIRIIIFKHLYLILIFATIKSFKQNITNIGPKENF
jgi:hypothetical protein